VAKGTGRVAEQIIELARKHNLPLRQDRNLVQVLSLLRLDQEIPPHVYRAVAEILAFIYRQAQGNASPQPLP
jgi:flagellar biosynthesis protein